MEKETKDIDENIILFPSSGYIYLCDDYQGSSININSINYPSVRHAVLSFKTNNKKIKKEIAKKVFPGELKDYERQIKPVKNWNKDFIIHLYKKYTFEKFVRYPELAKKLSGTYPKDLKNIVLEVQQCFDIDEILNEENIHGKIALLIRSYFIKQETLTYP